MSSVSSEYVQGCFRHFAELCRTGSPLYAVLSPRMAEEPELLQLAALVRDRQPPVNVFFGAVHFLLLGGVEHPLAAFYPSVGGTSAPAGAWPAFTDFCRQFRDEIVDLVQTRRVQTNEVGRCGLLMPAFARAQRLWARPFYLIEVGCSAGLNLLFDRYRYEYIGGRSCGPPSPAVIRTELLDPGAIEVPHDLPKVSGRVGVDIAPVDVTDGTAMRWVEAMIWPDQLDRIRLHRHARTVARKDPPRLIPGDGLALVPGLVADVPAEDVPCVFHSYTAYQMTKEWRSAFRGLMNDLGRARDLVYVSLEWLGDDPGPQLHLALWRDRELTRTHLADGDHHGRWLRRPAREGSARHLEESGDPAEDRVE